MVIGMAAWSMDWAVLEGQLGGRPPRKGVADVKGKGMGRSPPGAELEPRVGLKVGLSVAFTKMTRTRGGLGDMGSLGPVSGGRLRADAERESLGLEDHHVSGTGPTVGGC